MGKSSRARKKQIAAAKKQESRNNKRRTKYAAMAGQDYSPAKLAKKAAAASNAPPQPANQSRSYSSPWGW